MASHSWVVPFSLLFLLPFASSLVDSIESLHKEIKTLPRKNVEEPITTLSSLLLKTNGLASNKEEEEEEEEEWEKEISEKILKKESISYEDEEKSHMSTSSHKGISDDEINEKLGKISSDMSWMAHEKEALYSLKERARKLLSSLSKRNLGETEDMASSSNTNDKEDSKEESDNAKTKAPRSSSSSKSKANEESKDTHVYDLLPDYSLAEPINDWDARRELWLKQHPHITNYTQDGKPRMYVVTGTQPTPCKSPGGDHLLLRFFKNKVDYCRLHGLDLFYNMNLLRPDMPTFWAKLPLIRATMLSHPEADWIWWIDSDALITDMEFEIPLEKYNDYNLIVFGWEYVVFTMRSWVGLNAGSFLIRNCQWSFDFMERWASMGPQAPLADAAPSLLSTLLPDRPIENPTDDQAVLVYLLIKERDRWGPKFHLELEYFLSGYWVELVDEFEKIEEVYKQMEKEQPDLSSKEEYHNYEKLMVEFGKVREKYAYKLGLKGRRPFITHFTGCQPCSGNHNNIYKKDDCINGMIRALNYADNQVLRSYGYTHVNLLNSDLIPI